MKKFFVVIACVFAIISLASCLSKEEIKEVGDILSEDIRNAYVAEIQEWSAPYQEADSTMCGYFLYDIDADGIPELWLTGGTCEADRQLAGFTYELEGIKPIYEASASHTTIYEGDAYLITLSANGGEVLESKITNEDDSTKVDIIYDGKMSDEAGFVEPTEAKVTLIPYANLDPIDEWLKENESENE